LQVRADEVDKPAKVVKMKTDTQHPSNSNCQPRSAFLPCLQVRADEVDKPAKVAKKRALPAGGGGSGRSFGGGRGGWGAWQRSNSTNSTKSGAAEPAAAAETAPATAAAAAGGQDEGGAGDSSMQQLYGLWQTDAFVRRAVDGKVPRNERGNVEVPPLAKSMPVGEQ
jgi:xeroderma pigmentosum group C-complementing protein